MQKESPKKIWLYSYGASGPNITRDLWMSSTGIEIDECYILTQRDLKYMLIHTPKRVAICHMKTAFKSLETETGVKGICVFGYDEISYGDGVWEHPGMKLMIEHMNSKSPFFEYWLQHGSLETNKRGILTKFMVSDDLKIMSRIQLLNYIQDYKMKTESKILEIEQERDARILEMEQEYREMEAEIYRLRDKNKAQRSEYRLLQVDNQMLRTLLSKAHPQAQS